MGSQLAGRVSAAFPRALQARSAFAGRLSPLISESESELESESDSAGGWGARPSCWRGEGRGHGGMIGRLLH